MVFVLRRS